MRWSATHRNSPATVAVPPPSGPVINATQTNLNTSLNPSQWGQSVTVTATVMSKAAPIAVSNEIVIFKDGQIQIGSSITGVNGVATLTLTGLSVGTHDLTAFYGGDSSCRQQPLQRRNADRQSG